MTQTMDDTGDDTGRRAATILRRLHVSRRLGEAIVLGILLVILGDQMIYAREGGISGVVFYSALAIGVGIICRDHLRSTKVALAALLFMVSILPIIEANTFVSLLCGLVGVSVLALALWRKLPQDFIDLPTVLGRFYLLLPARFVSDVLSAAFAGPGWSAGRYVLRSILVWIVPAGLALVFLLLFASANPVIEKVLSRIDIDMVLDALNPGRMVLWFLLAVLIWPFLQLRLPRRRKRVNVPPIPGTPVRSQENLLFGRAAILRSLILFNLMFAVQTALDLVYLWGGLSLPDGMSYASYAHRGAYPLIVTALLAAAFVLAAMRKGGPGESSTTIRRLVYFWIAQNVLLVVSSLGRLWLYVETYSLTELRVAAAIWMGLVAIGLMLICARIALRQTNRWLIATNLFSLSLVLYASSFIDYAWLISTYNVEHSLEMTGHGAPLDLGYLKTLGPGVIPALDSYISAEVVADSSRKPAAMEARGQILWYWDEPEERDWRAWSFRDWRLDRYLDASPLGTDRLEPYDWSFD